MRGVEEAITYYRKGLKIKDDNYDLVASLVGCLRSRGLRCMAYNIVVSYLMSRRLGQDKDLQLILSLEEMRAEMSAHEEFEGADISDEIEMMLEGEDEEIKAEANMVLMRIAINKK